MIVYGEKTCIYDSNLQVVCIMAIEMLFKVQFFVLVWF